MIHSPKKYGQLNVKVFRTVGEEKHHMVLHFSLAHTSKSHTAYAAVRVLVFLALFMLRTASSLTIIQQIWIYVFVPNAAHWLYNYTQLFAHIHLKIHQHNSAFCCIFCGAVFYFSFWDVSGRFCCCCCVCPPLAVKS